MHGPRRALNRLGRVTARMLRKRNQAHTHINALERLALPLRGPKGHCLCNGLTWGAAPYPNSRPVVQAAIGLHAQELYLDGRQACCDAPTKVTQILLNLNVA